MIRLRTFLRLAGLTVCRFLPNKNYVVAAIREALKSPYLSMFDAASGGAYCYRSVTHANLLAAGVGAWRHDFDQVIVSFFVLIVNSRGGSLGAVVGHLYNYFFLVVFLIGVAIVFLASEFGWRLGIRTEGHGASGNISALEQSLLGFLALIVGFTFLMALTRFETRREAVLNEANAIGTTALRARLLPEPHRTESLKLLREYAQIRIDYIPTGKSFAELPNSY